LHTSCYFEQYELVERLVKVTAFNNDVVDPNLSDYKGAAPLHRCKNLQIIRLLLDYGADVNIKDLEGNKPLHVKCYGEKGKPSELKCVELLLNYGADMTARNKKVFS
jgi:ankyrin repeat protein